MVEPNIKTWNRVVKKNRTGWVDFNIALGRNRDHYGGKVNILLYLIVLQDHGPREVHDSHP